MLAPSINPTDFAARDFDYLIIGGGTAGLTVAARLSEDTSILVGVLEAGPNALGEDVIDTPTHPLQAQKYDWRVETVPQKGLDGRTFFWDRGKVLGGTSALNFMTWNRGSRGDYDSWAKLGNKGWGWNDLLPFFKKTETIHSPEKESHAFGHQYSDPEAIGTNGPIHVSHSKQYSGTHEIYKNTLKNLGILENNSHLSGSNVGVWKNLISMNPERNIRSYAASAYLEPNLTRKNLIVLTEAHVHEIILGKENGEWTATGARFAHSGNTFIVSALREVILSAGSIQSPQLLELSGIGNPHILAEAGVEVKLCNPNVGENVQDHIMTAAVFEIDPCLEDINLGIPGNPLCYLPISAITSQEKLRQLISKIENLHKYSPEEVAILKNRFENTALGQVEFIFDLGNWNTNFLTNPSDGKKYASILPILQHPFSRGSIHIQKQPESGYRNGDRFTTTDKPIIDPGYYSGAHGEIDIEIMMESLRFCDKVFKSAPLSGIVRSKGTPPSSIDSDEELKEWVVKNTTTDWHPIGSCAMGGHGGIRSGVVDDRLRVFGVNRLRVIDASRMPLQISAHLQATVYAIAEKGASLVREDNLERRPNYRR